MEKKTALSTLKRNHTTALERLKVFSLQNDTAYLYDEASLPHGKKKYIYINILALDSIRAFFHVHLLFICTGTEALAFADCAWFQSVWLKPSKVAEVSIDRTHSKPHAINDLDKILLTPEIPKQKQENNNNSWRGSKRPYSVSIIRRSCYQHPVKVVLWVNLLKFIITLENAMK